MTTTKSRPKFLGAPLLLGGPILGTAIILGGVGLLTGHLSLPPKWVAAWKKKTMSDHDRTVAVVQHWARMGQNKPRNFDLLVGLWSPNEALAFYPDACQILTGDIQAEFLEKPGLARGDISVKDFNDAKNPSGRIKTVDDLATLVHDSPAQ